MIIRADARQIPLLDGCVQTCVTSPPYFGLRDYGHGDQIGLEPSPHAYVASLVAVFAEVWRVLKADGTVWCNIGDSYVGAANSGGVNRNDGGPAVRVVGLAAKPGKPKDLLGIPWRVAFALQAWGWYLRSDIIWAKGVSFCPTYHGGVMPESVTDRPTRSHEYLFLLTKRERYYFDADAIKEQGVYPAGTLAAKGSGKREGNRRGTKATALKESGQRNDYSAGSDGRLGIGKEGYAEYDGFRNVRTVWTIQTRPYFGAHFAVMPEQLVEPCILAGSRPGDLVLDPFVGSGTVVAVAQRLGRRGVGTDLSYQQLARERTAQRGIPFSAA